MLAREPYRLAREVWGIGFKTADRIARAVGIPEDAPARLEAGMLFALSAAADDGHTLLPEAELTKQASDLLDVAAPPIQEAITSLLEEGDLVAWTPQDDEVEERLVALAPFARAEQGLASRLTRLAEASDTPAQQGFAEVDWSVAFNWLETRQRLSLAPEQQAAVEMALTRPVILLTGGPGTGKTHTLQAVLRLARTRRLRCLLAAPTGRAAKRMSEATGGDASTLHRLLELRPGGAATYGPDHPLEADLLIVDEVSMLDALLANQLVRALAPGTHLLLVGDPDQLPSVGAGNVLGDLLASAQFPVTRLTRIFRQGAGSGIARNARRINAGQLPQFGREIEDCYFLPAETPEEAAKVVIELLARRLPDHYGFAPHEMQVLSPLHRGAAGVSALNAGLQARLNPGREGQEELRSGGRVFRAGDRVLQLRNDYDLEVFNGDLGTVERVDMLEGELVVQMDDEREVRYPSTSLYALSHAYAISVHKAQGAEFRCVVLPVLTSHAILLGRTLLYTAVTRARELVVIVGQRRALALGVRDWRQRTRQTALRGLLEDRLSVYR